MATKVYRLDGVEGQWQGRVPRSAKPLVLQFEKGGVATVDDETLAQLGPFMEPNGFTLEAPPKPAAAKPTKKKATKKKATKKGG